MDIQSQKRPIDLNDNLSDHNYCLKQNNELMDKTVIKSPKAEDSNEDMLRNSEINFGITYNTPEKK